MALIFTLVERTPYRLRYLTTAGGSTAAFDTGILVNRNGPTPDLRGDASVWMGEPIWQLVSTPVATQVAARRLMFGDGLLTNIAIETPRGNVDVIPRNTSINVPKWSCDANEGAAAGDPASAGFAVLVISGSTQVFDQTYVDIYYEHTYDR